MIKISIVQKKLRMFLTIEKIVVNIAVAKARVCENTKKKENCKQSCLLATYEPTFAMNLSWKKYATYKIGYRPNSFVFFLPYFVDDILSGENVRASIFFSLNLFAKNHRSIKSISFFIIFIYCCRFLKWNHHWSFRFYSWKFFILFFEFKKSTDSLIIDKFSSFCCRLFFDHRHTHKNKLPIKHDQYSIDKSFSINIFSID